MKKVYIQYDNSGWSSSEEILRSIFFWGLWKKLIEDFASSLLGINPTLLNQEIMRLDSMDKNLLNFIATAACRLGMKSLLSSVLNIKLSRKTYIASVPCKAKTKR